MTEPVCVLGLGLIGGSVLRAARAAGRDVFGYNRAAGAAAARADGFDASDDLPAVLRRAAAQQALIVLAVPVPALPTLLGQVAEHAAQCPLTDVTSVKTVVAQQVHAYGLTPRFVGGHPMAGTVQSGWAAGRADLFTGAPWVLSVDDGVPADVWARTQDLARECGAFVVPARAAEHDAAAAAISHLPHLLAEALAAHAATVPLGFALAAGSFRDGTRVAGTAPELVRAMCEANAGPLADALESAVGALRAAGTQLVTDGTVADLVAAGHTARVAYDELTRPEITGTVLGDPGWREALAAAGRAGAVLRSALPVRDSPG